MKRAITSLASGIFLLCMVSQAHAVPMTFGINTVLTDLGMISGTIELDTDLGMPLTDWNLTTSGGMQPGTTYNTGNSTLSFNTLIVALIDAGGPPILVLSYSPGLVIGQPVPAPLTVGITEITTGGIRAGATVVAAVPEPSAILLFGSGLIGLGLWRYRKQRKS